MRDMRALSVATALILIVLVAAGCGGGTTASGSAAASRAPSAIPSFALPSVGIPSFAIPSIGVGGGAGGGGGDGEVGGKFTLVVEGSSLAGTWPADPATGGCFVSAGMIQLALDAPGTGPDAKGLFMSLNADLEAAKAGTEEFVLSVAFGLPEDNGTVAGYPGSGGADGNLKANDTGSALTFDANGSAFAVNGTTGASETMKLRVTAECTVVGRF